MFTFTVVPDNGEPFQATATSRDVVIWEKLGKGRSMSRVAQEPTMGDLYSLAHVAARRLQLFTGTLEEFEHSVDIDFEGEDEAPDPTQRAR